MRLSTRLILLAALVVCLAAGSGTPRIVSSRHSAAASSTGLWDLAFIVVSWRQPLLPASAARQSRHRGP